MKKNILIVILLIGFLGVSFYLVYDKVLKKEPETVQKNQEEEDQENITDVEIQRNEMDANSLFVQELIERYDYYQITNVEISNTLYQVDSITSSSLDRNYLMQTARKNMGQMNPEFPSSFSNEEMFRYIQKLYGPAVSLEPGSFGTDSCGSYQYNAATGEYTYVQSMGCGGISASSMERKIVSAIQEDNQILVEVAVAILNGYTNTVDNPIGGAINGLTPDTFNIENDYDKVSHYQYKFVYDENTYNYYLDSITRVS